MLGWVQAQTQAGGTLQVVFLLEFEPSLQFDILIPLEKFFPLWIASEDILPAVLSGCFSSETFPQTDATIIIDLVILYVNLYG